jgi:hypothetical protein
MTARVPGTRAGRKPQIYVGLPTIDDDAPTELKNQMALRATTWVEGRCPSCGAEPELTAYVELTSSVLSSSTHSTVPLPNCSTRASRKAQKPQAD